MRFVKGFFRKRKRQKITVISSLLIVYSIAAAGILSYFHGSDRVVNRITAENGSVDIVEPEWKEKGKEMAYSVEPGMEIPKDPRAVNDLQTDFYIRLKLTVRFDENDIPSEKRNRGIFNALMLNDEHFIEDTSKPLNEWICRNSDYVFVEHGQNLNSRETVFYFYYTAGDKDGPNDIMRVVKQGESTSVLFTSLKIPVYKDEYIGIFNVPYTIEVQAEAIPAGQYSTAPKVDDIIADFTNK